MKLNAICADFAENGFFFLFFRFFPKNIFGEILLYSGVTTALPLQQHSLGDIMKNKTMRLR
ncbi:hypothetical protein COY95_04875 [Candidatus Woesearchaeota archaeon CG_4_10_14_0_8_um_filter_47_5]|nr:MAG: hypothetical protein COY95_04875 [Candidatus Woesearchaeota archaeon CG_4_10_14_0_8_um_filter_47_5]